MLEQDNLEHLLRYVLTDLQQEVESQGLRSEILGATGGVRDKVLAAYRVGIHRVLLPQQNAKDLVDVPEDVCNQMKLIFCDRIEQVLENALIRQQDVEHHINRLAGKSTVERQAD